MTPQEYATLFRRFVTQFPAYEPKPFLVAVGPRGHSKDLDLGWTNGFFAAMGDGHRSRVDGLSVHYYSDFRNTPERVSSFEPSGWYDVVHKGFATEDVIEQHWTAMGKYDHEHRIKFVVDEWGVWYKPGEEITPAYLLSQPVTLRDAVHTAVTFDVFNRHADKIAMANVAQTINCIHSLFLAQGDRYTRTPPYYVFEMYRNHMGARLAPIKLNVPDLTVPSREGTVKMPGLSGSASVKSKVLSVTLTNPSLDSSVAANIGMTTGSFKEGRGTVLTHTEMTARNTFEEPENVKPKPHPVSVRGNECADLHPSSCSGPARDAVGLGLRSLRWFGRNCDETVAHTANCQEVAWFGGIVLDVSAGAAR